MGDPGRGEPCWEVAMSEGSAVAERRWRAAAAAGTATLRAKAAAARALEPSSFGKKYSCSTDVRYMHAVQ
jgi:hypothetical protein